MIESLFGLIKEKFGSQILVRLREMAERRALCMIVLYNLRLLLESGKISLLLCSFLLSLPQRIFRTASTTSLTASINWVILLMPIFLGLVLLAC